MQGSREPRTPPTRWATALSFAQELKRIDKQELKVSDGDMTLNNLGLLAGVHPRATRYARSAARRSAA